MVKHVQNTVQHAWIVYFIPHHKILPKNCQWVSHVMRRSMTAVHTLLYEIRNGAGKIPTKRVKTKASSSSSTSQEQCSSTQHLGGFTSRDAPVTRTAVSRGAISGPICELGVQAHSLGGSITGRRRAVPVHPGRRRVLQSAALHLQVTVKDEDLLGADPPAAGHGASDRLPPVVDVNQLVSRGPVTDRGGGRS